jgi:Bacterial protein of unknown function (DUF937)/PRC-barrel domain
MAQSIVSTISRFLTPELIGNMASASDLDRSLAQKAVMAAVPTILSALTDVAGKPGGAQQLASAVAQQPTDLLAGIARGLTGSAQTANQGSSLLSSLLGSGTPNMLATTVAKFLGIGERPMSMLMGLLTPVILGVLGREQRAAGLDDNGLAHMLTGQKDEIAAAMPAGLSRLLETNGLREGIGWHPSQERRSSPAYDPPQTASAQRAVSNMKTSTRGVTWPYWVLPLLALGGLLWYALSGNRAVEPVRTSQTATPQSQPLPNISTKTAYLSTARDDWTSIGASPNEYTNQDIYNTAGEKLGTIKDLLIGPDGKAAAGVINVGRYLGIGDKDIAVPFSALRVERHGDSRRIVIDATKEDVQAAPTFARRPGAKQ